MSKVSYSEVVEKMRDFSNLSLEKRGGFGYATGFYECVLAGLIVDLPTHKQEEFLRHLEIAKKSLD